MLPILWIYRGGNFTEKQIEDNYGDLKLARTIKQWIFWLGIILGCLLIIMGIAIYYFKIRNF
jgi:cytochrome b subunit of formate dehydrogenase